MSLVFSKSRPRSPNFNVDAKIHHSIEEQRQFCLCSASVLPLFCEAPGAEEQLAQILQLPLVLRVAAHEVVRLWSHHNNDHNTNNINNDNDMMIYYY